MDALQRVPSESLVDSSLAGGALYPSILSLSYCKLFCGPIDPVFWPELQLWERKERVREQALHMAISR